MLERAWNSIIIQLISERVEKIKTLLEQGHTIYSISNTNELNIFKILALFRRDFPEMRWMSGIDISLKLDQQPVKLAENIYLCTSYRYGAFKTGTPGLIETLVRSLPNVKNIRVISQYTPDITEARRLQVGNAQLADEFFTANQQRSGLHRHSE